MDFAIKYIATGGVGYVYSLMVFDKFPLPGVPKQGSPAGRRTVGRVYVIETRECLATA